MPSVTWTQLKTDNNPLARSSHGVSVVGDTLYIFGGEHSARNPIGAELNCIDLKSDQPKWTEVEVEQAPLARFGHSQVTANGSIYVFGGRMGTDIGEKLMNDLWRFDPKTSKWTELTQTAQGQPPSPRSFQSSVVLGNCMYVFGGCSGEGRMSDLHSYDIDSNCWKQLKTGGFEGRGGIPLVALGSSIFVLGGFAGREMKDVHRYDLKSDAWTQLGDLPEPVSVAVTQAVHGNIVMFGGELAPSERGHAGAGNFSDKTTIFSQDMTKILSRDGEGSRPQARGWTSGSVWNEDTIVIVGGLTGDDQNPERLMDVWRAKVIN